MHYKKYFKCKTDKKALCEILFLHDVEHSKYKKDRKGSIKIILDGRIYNKNHFIRQPKSSFFICLYLINFILIKLEKKHIKID